MGARILVYYLQPIMTMKKKTLAERSQALDRRRFLKAGSLFTLGSLILPFQLLGKGTGKGRGAAGDCLATTDDILGPYYLPGSPVTNMVAGPNEPGDRLYISGSVLSNDCLTPVEGVTIEVWQANAAAVYDTSPALNLRATFLSGVDGTYAFETIMPGPYLNGAQYRPSHIHFRVNKPGFPELITQLYFAGDPYIAQDPWASQPDAADRIIPLNPLGGGEQEGLFDIVLDGMVGIKPNRYGTDGDVLPIHPNPMHERCSIHFNVFRAAQVGVHVTGTYGELLVSLIDEQLEQGRFTTQWDGRNSAGMRVAPGTYLVQLTMDGRPVKAQRVVVQ